MSTLFSYSFNVLTKIPEFYKFCMFCLVVSENITISESFLFSVSSCFMILLFEKHYLSALGIHQNQHNICRDIRNTVHELSIYFPKGVECLFTILFWIKSISISKPFFSRRMRQRRGKRNKNEFWIN